MLSGGKLIKSLMIVLNYMVNKTDPIKIIEPSKEVFKIIEEYTNLVQKILPTSKITLIGSFAIPMCGKEEIDLLVETDDIKKAQKEIEEKSDGRFGIGPRVGEVGFSRSKKKFGIICELHFVPKGYKKIQNYLKFIENLKSKPDIIKKFEKLKRSLDGSTEEEYKNEKRKFIKENKL